MIADPPLLAGGVHRTTALALSAVAVPIVGTPGAVGATGVTVFEAAEKAPEPTAFAARTRKEYAVPLTSPVAVKLVDTGTLVRTTVAPLVRSTVYPVIGEPPSAGAVQVTVADALPAVAAPITGAAGAVTGADGVTAADRADTGPGPTALTADTSNVYAVPLVRAPITVLVTLPTVVVRTRVAPENVRTT
jgi:hypothetical protein